MLQVLLALLLASPLWSHHEPIEIRVIARDTHIVIDHHGMTPFAIWFRGDGNQPLPFVLRSSVKKPGKIKATYVINRYTNRSFTIQVLYINGLKRKIEISKSGEQEDKYNEPLPASWGRIKAGLQDADNGPSGLY
ncbi:MAG: hypothetical protein OXN90_15895 [Gemmatimonadota bacterium]|nr:hypothetical protein [Gemmatimonadota bacterium]